MRETTCSRRPELGLLCLSGADARRFLHAQTTQRIDDLPVSEMRTAAWLTARGRVIALFDVVPDGDDLTLLLPADMVDKVAEGLRRFVLRADVGIEPVTQSVVYSLLGASDAWLDARGIDLAPHGVVARDGLIYARQGTAWIDVIGPGGTVPPALADLDAADPDAAALAAIRLGRPEIPACLSEHYIPQMLNLEHLGGISFTKGCYPGQEIVARTQNLGAVKRRLARFGVAAGRLPEPGDEIVDARGDIGGEVNRSAAVGAGFELLAVVRLDAAADSMTLGGDGRGLTPLPLPDPL